MSDFNKSYRIRTEVGKDKYVSVNLQQNYDVLEVMSLKIDQTNAYRFHTSNYGVVAGRVLANGGLGIPNAKISVFIGIDNEDANDVVKSILYPYNTTHSKNNDGVKYNLLASDKVGDCHAVIGTFPEKQYLLDNGSVLEVFEKYYKYTTRTNHAGDYMIFGIPTGSQTIHVDLDLSDIGILSQRPRDMVYKGYDINQFENPNKFKIDTNLNNLVQVISQDNIVDVISFWGDESEGTIGITRCDIDIQYKFEPTCVFMGSIVSDTSSNGISKKCIPTPGMGAMDDVVTGTGTIEMIRKTPDGNVEEFQIQGTQLIDGNGVWCYQIPMNLDYMTTDEFGNMVPTNDPDKGVPTRTKVRFRIGMQDFENDNSNIFRCKMLVPHNPKNGDCDYQFGTKTKEDSFRDLFWNGVYSVKSYIPRIQKGSNWKNEKFTGFKRVNYYGDKNPIPYNNIRIKIPFMFTIICALIKMIIKVIKFSNSFRKTLSDIGITKRSNSHFSVFNGTICSEDLDNVCVIPGINIQNIVNGSEKYTKALLARTLEVFALDYEGGSAAEDLGIYDSKSIDNSNNPKEKYNEDITVSVKESGNSTEIYGIRATDNLDYVIQCIEMNLAQEYKVMQFDFYNDWINGLIYIPRWVRNITKKRNYLWGAIKVGGKIKACNQNFKSKRRNIVQQCALTYQIKNNNHDVVNYVGCDKKLMICHKSNNVRKTQSIFSNGGVVYETTTSKGQYVYYFKPCENSKIKLYATDIILLGTLNDCDKWGIPNSLNELQSSTFQMPTNIALTDSDIDGDTYDNESSRIYFHYTKTSGKNAELKVDEMIIDNKALALRDEDGNYTEMSGIEWGYSGPQQMKGATDTNLYKPGGHFLGLTCANSSTTVKSCVNLSRICEHGVWMSQRQELSIPQSTKNTFVDVATTPSGFISKDEISDTVFRRHFATMNINKLATITNPDTGYPVYDFRSVTPLNFGGELDDKINHDTNFNRKISDTYKEHHYDYGSTSTSSIELTYKNASYYNRTKATTGDANQTINEKQIVRTGEWMDNEYWRFRFGILDTSSTTIMNEKKKKYLISNNGMGYYSFPMYENSFYFYFGLKNGATALDEFKKKYYAVCESTNELMQTDKNVTITNITTKFATNDSCNNGQIRFQVKADDMFYQDESYFELTLNGENYTEKSKSFSSNDTIGFNNLKSGVYTLKITSSIDETISIEKDVYIDKVTVESNVTKNNFIKDIDDLSITTIFGLNRVGENAYGGYIEIANNAFTLTTGSTETNESNDDDESTGENIFNSSIVNGIVVKGYPMDGASVTTEFIIRSVSYNNKTQFECIDSSTNDVISVVNAQIGADGTYRIPVPAGDYKYDVYVEFLVINCNIVKPDIHGIGNAIPELFRIGSVEIEKAKPLNIIYNDISHRLFFGIYGGNEYDNEFEGWWNNPYGILGTQPENIQWKLKSGLYMDKIPANDSSSGFRVKIVNEGGVAPYTEIVGGMKEDFSTPDTGLTRSDFESVKIPTLNYSKGGLRRKNFTYKLQDVNGQVYPTDDFMFPVIYKPFFMEMGLWYFDNVGKYYIVGNVYNGKTWDYSTEGFNECKVNGLMVANLADVTKPDMELQINEEWCEDNQQGGYGYIGNYHEYNARKVSVSRELEGVTYGLYNNSPIKRFDLSIGCNHTDTDGSVYHDSTNAILSNFTMPTFTLTGKTETNGDYYVKMSLTDNENGYDIYPFYNDKVSGYEYPLKNNKVTINSKLFREIMLGEGISASTINPDIMEPGTGYININNIDSSQIHDLYYLAIPKERNAAIQENLTVSNSLSKLKSISVSNLVNLKKLSTFYPLRILIETTYIKEEKSGQPSYTIQMKVKADNTGSDAAKIGQNFVNKTFEFHIYKSTDGVDTGAQVITARAQNTEFTIDLLPYKEMFGFIDDSITLTYWFDVYDLENEKAPTSYDVGKQLTFDFIDKTTSQTE